MKRKILLIETGEGAGGSFVSLVVFLKKMNREAFDPVVCCFNPTRFLEEIDGLEIPVHILDDPLFTRRPAVRYFLMRVLQRAINQFVPAIRPVTERLIHFRTLRRLRQIAAETAPDLLVLNTQINRDLFGLFLAKQCGLPVVAHLQSRIGCGLTPGLAARVNRQVRGLIANSISCRDYWKGKGLDPDRMEIVFNSVDPEPAPPVDLCAVFGLPPGTRVVCCAARLIHIKGQDVLIRAFARLADRLDPVVLLLVGEGKARPRLERLARRLGVEGKVLFAGWRPDACSLIAASDLLVLPSREEALGLTLQEAMVFGVPAIGSRTGGIPEVVDHERNGMLAEPGDAVSLAAAIERILSDRALREKLVEGGRETLIRKFSPEVYVRSVERIYLAAIEEAPSA